MWKDNLQPRNKFFYMVNSILLVVLLFMIASVYVLFKSTDSTLSDLPVLFIAILLLALILVNVVHWMNLYDFLYTPLMADHQGIIVPDWFSQKIISWHGVSKIILYTRGPRLFNKLVPAHIIIHTGTMNFLQKMIAWKFSVRLFFPALLDREGFVHEATQHGLTQTSKPELWRWIVLERK